MGGSVGAEAGHTYCAGLTAILSTPQAAAAPPRRLQTPVAPRALLRAQVAHCGWPVTRSVVRLAHHARACSHVVRLSGDAAGAESTYVTQTPRPRMRAPAWHTHREGPLAGTCTARTLARRARSLVALPRGALPCSARARGGSGAALAVQMPAV